MKLAAVGLSRLSLGGLVAERRDDAPERDLAAVERVLDQRRGDDLQRSGG